MALLQIAEPGEAPAPHQHRLAVGIDLGTTNSLVATVRSGIPVALPDENGRPLLPSIVRYGDDEVTVGYVAQDAQAQDPQNTIVSVKRSWAVHWIWRMRRFPYHYTDLPWCKSGLAPDEESGRDLRGNTQGAGHPRREQPRRSLSARW
jgi:molecular chaperone HscA